MPQLDGGLGGLFCHPPGSLRPGGRVRRKPALSASRYRPLSARHRAAWLAHLLQRLCAVPAGRARPGWSTGCWTRPAPPANMRAAVLPLGDPFFHPRLKCHDGKVTLDLGEDTTPPGHRLHGRGPRFDLQLRFLPGRAQPSRATLRWALPPLTRSSSWPGFCRNSPIRFMAASTPSCGPPIISQRAHQVRSIFVTPCPEVVIRSAIRTAFPALAEQLRVSRVHRAIPSYRWCLIVTPLSPRSGPRLTRSCRFQNARRKFYFMQDYESRFYPAGSISALVEATYHFGFSGHLQYGSLRDIYTGSGGQAGVLRSLRRPCRFSTPKPVRRAPRRASDAVLLRPADASQKQFRAAEPGAADREEAAGRRGAHRDGRRGMAAAAVRPGRRGAQSGTAGLSFGHRSAVSLLHRRRRADDDLPSLVPAF